MLQEGCPRVEQAFRPAFRARAVGALAPEVSKPRLVFIRVHSRNSRLRGKIDLSASGANLSEPSAQRWVTAPKTPEPRRGDTKKAFGSHRRLISHSQKSIFPDSSHCRSHE